MKSRALQTLLVLLLVVTGVVGCNPDATYTVVYIVRHADVVYVPGGSTNPSLSDPEGVARAEALRQQFNGIALAAVYQTEKARTRQTAAPVANDHGLPPTEIPESQKQELVDHVLENHSGETVLIVNHSHNILDIIDLFGADRPFDPYPNEFDKLILLIHTELDGDTSAGVVAGEYGAPS